MKKRLIKMSFIASIFLLASGCEDDFLVQEPTQFVQLSQLEEAAVNNPEIVVGFIDGIYSLMIQTGSGGTNLEHDDFGHKGFDIFSDFICGDLALTVSTYGWYRASITELQCTQDFTFTDNRQVWQFYFSVIRSANTVIAITGGNAETEPETEENRHILAQALSLRAFAYFYLTQYMSNEYDPAAPILPIMDIASNEGRPKSTTAEVFQFMEDDLNRAITLFEGYNRPSKKQINRSVAQGLLAYVLAARGDRWQEVADLTNEVITTSGASIMSAADMTNSGFNNVAIPSWLWGYDITEDDGLGLVSWWGQMDLFTYSYAWAGDRKAMDASLFAAIPANDARKTQFNNNPPSQLHLMPVNKFYHPARVQGGQTSITTDYVYMRIEEMHLLHAEALSNLGQDGPARTALANLLSQRVPSTAYLNGLSGQALKDHIYLQTRIELWGEGKSYLAMKRNKATVTRGSNHLSLVGVPIPHNDERLTFEIPEREIQDNPFITDQN